MSANKNGVRENGHEPKVGPLTAQWNSNRYLMENKVNRMFDSLVAGLIIERPDDHMTFLDTKLAEIKAKGIDNVDWETFVYHLHPLRSEARKMIINDEVIPERVLTSPSQKEASYEPNLFKLTETAD